MAAATIVGYIATLMSTIKLIPELMKALKTHHLKDVAWGMLLLMCFSDMMWLLYGLHIQEMPLIIDSVLNFSLGASLIYLKNHYSKNNPPLLSYFFAKK